MLDLGIDQSLSKCAFTLLKDGQPITHCLSKTGKHTVKNKKKDTTYYDGLEKQIHHICMDLCKMVKSHEPDTITFEALSFGSSGNASRDLSGLFSAMRETLVVNFPDIPVYEVAPTSLKSYARDFLKPERQFEGVLKTGKPKKVKMEKKMVVEAVRGLYGQDYLKGYNYSSGLDDLADSTFLAHKTWSTYAKKES